NKHCRNFSHSGGNPVSHLSIFRNHEKLNCTISRFSDSRLVVMLLIAAWLRHACTILKLEWKFLLLYQFPKHKPASVLEELDERLLENVTDYFLRLHFGIWKRIQLRRFFV